MQIYTLCKCWALPERPGYAASLHLDWIVFINNQKSIYLWMPGGITP